MAKIITFGELMLRLQPYNYERFVQCDHVEFTFGGGEANVAVSLANYGMDAAFVTKLLNSRIYFSFLSLQNLYALFVVSAVTLSILRQILNKY